MPIVRVTRRAHFCSAHRLFHDEWSEERNREVFGDCSNPNWHGHNYVLDVTVEGPVDPVTGFVMDLKALKHAINERVVDDVDHRNLNLEVPWLAGIKPSTENFAVAIWERIEVALPEGVRLHRVHLQETPNNSVEYTGPQEG
ncbi:MAG: 6-pyruvoyl tetrahydrobiopterin synthase [Gemmatimonas sp. SG8_23]|jgi:6-pyruvoyltetrahydropterin/6-carboxytetrahydropterin synthase|nr:MAG: 6-pyruvoyl tetrahydrobiopterin synthase [Gemmatimonas sp. SG8_23]